jgi:hypothetical protein
MAAARPRRADSPPSKARCRSQTSSKRSSPSRPQASDDNESAEAEEIDTLLLSSLGYWEIKRDLIEERMAAIGSAIAPL